MPLTPLEELKLQKYFEECKVPEYKHDRVRAIAVMSKDDVPIKEIRRTLRTSFNFVEEYRSKLRRHGVY